jgi:hypothetical protein
VSPVRYELRFYIPEDYILHSHRREHLKSYNITMVLRDKEWGGTDWIDLFQDRDQ